MLLSSDCKQTYSPERQVSLKVDEGEVAVLCNTPYQICAREAYQARVYWELVCAGGCLFVAAVTKGHQRRRNVVVVMPVVTPCGRATT